MSGSGLLTADYADTSAALGGPAPTSLAPPPLAAPDPVVVKRHRSPQGQIATPAESVSAVPKNPENDVTQSQVPWGKAPPGLTENINRAFTQIHGGESDGSDDLSLRNPSSTASGPMQITKGTFVNALRKNYPAEVQSMSDDQVWALRSNRDWYDKGKNANMWDNSQTLIQNKVAPTSGNLVLAWRLGPQGAIDILRAAQTNPNARAGDIVPGLNAPGNGGAANMTVGQLITNPYAHGGGDSSAESPAHLFTLQQGQNTLQQMMEEFKRGHERVDKLERDYKPPEVPPPPQTPKTDPLDTFGSLAGVFATLAAGISRTPAVAAMNGLAGAMHAAKENDWEAYKANWDQFKTQSDFAFRKQEQHSKSIKDALEMMQTNMSAGKAMLDVSLALSNDEHSRKLADQHAWVELEDHNEKVRKSAEELQQRQPVTEAAGLLRVAEQQRDNAYKSGDPAAIAAADDNVNRAASHLQQETQRLADIRRAQMGGFQPKTGSMSAQEELRLMAEWDKAHPGAPIEERAAFWNNIKGREDPNVKGARLDRAQQLKEDHENAWRELNERKDLTAREIADKRITATKEWHAQQADLAVRKLDDRATEVDRKQNELERHNKIEEQIKSDWHLTQAEKDVLNRDEAIRWHDLQNERGWGKIESTERNVDAQISSRERMATDKWRAQQLAQEGSLKAERKARFDELKATMPPDTPASKVWDAVDQQIMEAKAPHISEYGLRSAAERFIAGDKTALQGFGRNPVLFGKIESEIAKVAQERKLSGTDLTRIQQDFAAATKAVKDFATGKQGQTAQSLNVATQHLALLSEAARALAQNDSRTLNRIQNAFKNEFGWDEPITFNAIKTIVGSEVEKAVAGSAGALEDRRELRDGLSAQSTPEQLTSVIEGYKGLMAGQLQGLEKTYERTTKRTDFRDEFLLPEARKEMDRIAPRQQAIPDPTNAPWTSGSQYVTPVPGRFYKKDSSGTLDDAGPEGYQYVGGDGDFRNPRNWRPPTSNASSGGHGASQGPKDGETNTSKSGKPIVYRNGNWEYQ